jgi:hypothetical protein
VGDDEVRIPELPIERRGAEHDAGEPGDEELEQEGRAEEHRRPELILPPHIVASQLKILIPVGTAIAIVDSTKNPFRPGSSPP